MDINLLKAAWTDTVDPAELRLILLERFGRPGQYVNDPQVFCLPLADSSCRLKVKFSKKNKNIVHISPGPAFDSDQWDQAVVDIESTGTKRTIGRDFSFTGFAVTGSWRGTRTGVQIIPPPPGAPRPPHQIADHPFVLEFAVIESDVWNVTNFRRLRRHRQLTRVLNVLLEGGATIQPIRPRHFGAVIRHAGATDFETNWVQESYGGSLGEAFQAKLTPAATTSLEEVDPGAYYGISSNWGQGMRVPTDLDDSLYRYHSLRRKDQEQFDRAAFWMDAASRQHQISVSASFAFLAMAIEALVGRTDGTTAAFCEFIDRHAPGASKKVREKLYDLRSDIVHGSDLMEIDQGTHFGWMPPEQTEFDLTREFWGITRMALRNWLAAR